MSEPLLYEVSASGRMGVFLPELDVPASELPEEYLRDELNLPEVSEVQVSRHYVRLSQLNYGVDLGIYPLGSCTMKYNPKVNEDAARIPGFTATHPLQPEETVQGNLKMMYGLQEYLREIGGWAEVSLQPAAGAHGEFTGILMMRAYHEYRKDAKRIKMLVPDSAHGTNPASSAMSGYTTVEIKSDERGNVDLGELKAHCDDTVVGLMLTNPNTLGLFDEHVVEICQAVHDCGGLVYFDGANLNAMTGISKPADQGFDVMHYNLHKTFSTPHGGGGPGSGPVGANEKLAPFLPGPNAVKDGDVYKLHMPEQTIGRVKSFYGNFGIFLRAYTYIRMLGAEGLREMSENAVLNANYLRVRIHDVYPVPYDRICMHEFVAEGHIEGSDANAMDISKRLIDYGVHPPTNYFPLIVHEALMIEPCETEPIEELDRFADALLEIAEEAKRDPDLLHNAPHTAPVTRLDEVRAARQLTLRWKPESTK
jgi:glycine dehydrogenase subunit 2